MTYLVLYWEFFKIGLFAIGGGLASLPFLQEAAAKHGWITQDQLLNMIAISESTPGPIGINTATFVGYEVGGVLGGIIATLGEVSPSVIVIVLLAQTLRKYNDHPLVQGAFSAIRPAVAGLIGAVAIGLAQTELFVMAVWRMGDVLGALNLGAIAMFGVILFMLERFKWHPVLFLAGGAVVGIVFGM